LRSNLPKGGHSRGGVTTKIIALTPSRSLLCKPREGNGRNRQPDRLVAGAPTPQIATQSPAGQWDRPTICGLPCGKLLADRAFNANWLRKALAEAGIEAVIPPKSNRRLSAEIDRDT